MSENNLKFNLNWLNHLQHENHKPHLSSIVILADLIKRSNKQKIINVARSEYTNILKCSERYVSKIFEYLEEKNLIKRYITREQNKMKLALKKALESQYKTHEISEKEYKKGLIKLNKLGPDFYTTLDIEVNSKEIEKISR